MVAVDGTPVTGDAELAAALARSRRTSVEVTIEQRGRLRTLVLSLQRFDEAPPAELLDAARVVRVGEIAVDGAMEPDAVRNVLADAAPTPVEVEYELARTRISGPMEVRRDSHSALSLGWLGLGIVVLLGLVLIGSEGLTRRSRAGSGRLAAVAAGSVALSALTVTLVSDGVDPAFSLWALSAAVCWRAMSIVERPEPARMRPSSSVRTALVLMPALGVFAGAGFVGVGAVDAGTVREWLVRLDDFAIAAGGVGVAYFAADVWSTSRDPSRGITTRAGAVIGVLALFAFAAAATLALDCSPRIAATWALLGGSGFVWTSDIMAAIPALGPRRHARDIRRAGDGITPMLRRVAAVLPDVYEAWVVAGTGARWVEVRVADPTGDGDERAETRGAGEDLAGAFEMLSVEGGMFPRHARWRGNEAVEDDPFGDIDARLGLAAAVPLGPTDGVVHVFLAVHETDATPSDAPDGLPLSEVIALVEECDPDAVYAEAVAAAGAAWISEPPRAQPQPAVRPPPVPAAAQPAPEAPPPAPPAADPLDDAWLDHLIDALARQYPVDDPGALDEREASALDFLVSSREPALLVGEPSVGKEFVARAIHRRQNRDDARFGVLDCAVVPPSLVEPEIFGDGERPGLVTTVGKGTLLLKSASVVGDDILVALVDRLERCPARVIFAERYTGPETGVPGCVSAAIAVAAGDRAVHLSPLRDRPEDVRRFARYFLHRASMRYEAVAVEFDDEALEQLVKLPLRGNFGELRCVATRASLTAEHKVVTLRDLGWIAAATAAETAEPDELTDAEIAERDEIARALSTHGGNRTQTAQDLGFTRGKLLRRMKKYGIG